MLLTGYSVLLCLPWLLNKPAQISSKPGNETASDSIHSLIGLHSTSGRYQRKASSSPKTIKNALMEFRPLQRTGKADNITRGVHLPVKSPPQVFSTYRGLTSARPFKALFHASDAPGVRPSGCLCDKEPYSSRSNMPSWRYFQALFSSEEQKTTRSFDFRAFIPLTQCKQTNQSPSVYHTLLEFGPSRVLSPSGLPKTSLGLPSCTSV
jgi:hypothetical protein